MLLEPQLWILIGLSIAMLFTIEAVEEYLDGPWPQLRRPAHGWGVTGTARPLWLTVALFVLPGLVLTILNLALVLWQGLPYSSAQLLGAIFVVVGWLVFLATTTDLAGLGTYFENAGIVAPIALIMVLALGDLLLLISLLTILPENLGALLP